MSTFENWNKPILAGKKAKKEPIRRNYLDCKDLVEPEVYELLVMLSYKRPKNSESELDFISNYILSLGAQTDQFNNYIVEVGDISNNPILFSSHTDTVHRTPGRQTVMYGDGYATSTSGECLGADCTSGVWLMRQMILANIPGVYIFHREEESGAHGSKSVAAHRAGWLRRFRATIAFDRRGYSDVISHQMGRRMASEKFCQSLGGILNAAHSNHWTFDYVPCPNGTFTDTANYEEEIGECTNLSIGYFNQHCPDERQDVYFITILKDALIQADWSKLVFEKAPNIFESYNHYTPKYQTKSILPQKNVVSYNYGGHIHGFLDEGGENIEKRNENSLILYNQGWLDERMIEFIRDRPYITATMLIELGYDLEDLRKYARDTLNPKNV